MTQEEVTENSTSLVSVPPSKPLDGQGRGVFISTYGCQMNVNDTERMYTLLEMSNYTPVATPEEASVIIINSCSVREKPVHKVRSEVGTYKKLKESNPDLRIGVGGCVGSQEKQNLIKDAPLVDFVFGTDNIDTLPQLLSKVYDYEGVAPAAFRKREFVDSGFRHREPYHVETMVRNPGVATFVNITKGCDNFCTFCVVPFTRGREKSRPADQLLQDIKNLTKRGVKEVTLLGQNVNSYESSDGTDFGRLIERVALETDVERIRFTTSHPKDFNEELVEILNRHRSKVCDYIHLPFQSGSTRVLELMNRGYTREEYKTKIKMIKQIFPDVSLSTDIIVGFPTETEQDFQDTLEMVGDVGFETIFAFKYSPRPMTKAAKMEEQIDEDTKSDRLSRLFEFHDKMAFELVKKYEGRVMQILIEEYQAHKNSWVGRSTTNKLVFIPAGALQLEWVDDPRALIGRTIPVLIQEAFPAVLHGEWVSHA